MWQPAKIRLLTQGGIRAASIIVWAGSGSGRLEQETSWIQELLCCPRWHRDQQCTNIPPGPLDGPDQPEADVDCLETSAFEWRCPWPILELGPSSCHRCLARAHKR